MKKLLINATQPEVRVAIIDNGALIDLDIEQPEHEQLNSNTYQRQSNIYKAIITSIETHLDAVFVNFGSDRHGFLPLKEISKEYFINQPSGPISQVDIKKVLKVGQELVVQVQKEERDNKGAALTTFISLAGSYIVLMPNNSSGGGISRRIEGEERDQMKEALSKLELSNDMSVILRTAGVGKTADELSWDLNILLRYWEAIKQAAIAKPGPYLIHKESDVIIRAIRDYCRQDINEIIIDDKAAFDRAHEYFSQIRPDFVDRLKYYKDKLPLFSRFQIDQQIENAFQREVRLPSGGSISFDQTEALVAVDINSARATKGGNIEETAYHTNKEAAEEIAKQLKIRDLGGLIVIDFIDMSSTQHQKSIENTLRDAVRSDRARIQIGRISRFGLLEMSRQRLRSSLHTAAQIECPHCKGLGTIRSVESLGRAITHLIEEHAAKLSEGQLQVQVPVDVATFIINEKRDILDHIKNHSKLSVLIIPNPQFTSPNYEIKITKEDPSRYIPSYKLATKPKANTHQQKKSSRVKMQEPAINEFLSSAPSKFHSKKPHSEGLIKRLWSAMFGAEETPSISTENNTTPQKKTTPQKHNKSHNNTRRGNRGGQKQGHKNTPNKTTTDKKPTAKRKPANKSSVAPKKKQTSKSKRPNAKKNNVSTNKIENTTPLAITVEEKRHNTRKPLHNQEAIPLQHDTDTTPKKQTSPATPTQQKEANVTKDAVKKDTAKNNTDKTSEKKQPIQQIKTSTEKNTSQQTNNITSHANKAHQVSNHSTQPNTEKKPDQTSKTTTQEPVVTPSSQPASTPSTSSLQQVTTKKQGSTSNSNDEQ